MDILVSKWLVSGLVNGYIGVITHVYTNLLLTSWDVQSAGGKPLEKSLWNLGALVLWNGGFLFFLVCSKHSNLKAFGIYGDPHQKSDMHKSLWRSQRLALKVFCRLKCVCFFDNCLKRSYLSCWKDVENTLPGRTFISIGEPPKPPQSIVECRVWIMSFDGILYFFGYIGKLQLIPYIIYGNMVVHR